MDGFIEDMLVFDQLIVGWLVIMNRLIVDEFVGPERWSTVTGSSEINNVTVPVRLRTTLVPATGSNSINIRREVAKPFIMLCYFEHTTNVLFLSESETS